MLGISDEEGLSKNNIVFKIQNATVRTDQPNLCSSCREALHTVGASSGRERIVCLASYNSPYVMTEPIAKCNTYRDKTKPSLDDMKDIAWSLQTDKGGKILGFKSPDQLRKESAR